MIGVFVGCILPECILVTSDEDVRAHVRDKLNISHPGATQNKKKTVPPFPFPVPIHRMLLKESTVHLPLFSWHCFKPNRCLFVQIHFSASHMLLDDAVIPFKSLLFQFFQYSYRWIWRFPQPLVYLLLVLIQLCGFWCWQCILRFLWWFCVPFSCPRIYVVFFPNSV